MRLSLTFWNYSHGSYIFLCRFLVAKDPDGDFMADELPSGSNLSLLQSNLDSEDAVTPEDQAAANSGSFKLLGFALQYYKYRILISYNDL